MKNAGVDIDDETQMDEYCMRNRNALKKRYGIVELQDWYIEEIDPKVEIIPIHTECAGGFHDLRIRPELKSKIRKGS